MNDKLIITKYLSRNFPITHQNVDVCISMGENGRLVGRTLIGVELRQALGYQITENVNKIIDDYIKELIKK